MTERDALFAAICANPDDDTSRLVFADWLEENGDSKRAGYIRASVDEYRRVTSDTSVSAVHEFFESDLIPSCDVIDWSEVDDDMHRLSTAVKTTLLHRAIPNVKSEKLPKIKGVRFERINRGFFDGIHITQPAEFLRQSKNLFRTAPITSIWFNRLSGEEAKELLRSGVLAQIRELGFGSFVSPEAIRAIGNHRDAAGIWRLELEAGTEGHEQCEGIASGIHWKSVKVLELMHIDNGFNGEPDRLIAELLHRPAFQRIQRLVAWGNELGNATARAIATVGLSELRFLDLGVNEIENSGAGAIARSKSLRNLRYLDLSSNNITGEVGSALIATPKLSNLAVLRLDGMPPELKPLTSASRGPTLRVLQLDGSELTDSALRAMASCPATHGLWYLSLSSCFMGDQELRALTTGMGIKHLKVLNLSHNHLTKTGMKVLAEWPVSLRLLDISGNKIGDDGAKALMRSQYLKSLKHLAISGGGTARLRKHFGKKVVP
jgi:uncharacterized protein (TIGR02996 family)